MRFKVKMEFEYSESKQFAKDMYDTTDPKKVAEREKKNLIEDTAERISLINRKKMKVSVKPMP